MTLNTVINVLTKNTKRSMMPQAPIMSRQADVAITEEVQAKKAQGSILG